MLELMMQDLGQTHMTSGIKCSAHNINITNNSQTRGNTFAPFHQQHKHTKKSTKSWLTLHKPQESISLAQKTYAIQPQKPFIPPWYSQIDYTILQRVLKHLGDKLRGASGPTTTKSAPRNPNPRQCRILNPSISQHYERERKRK